MKKLNKLFSVALTLISTIYPADTIYKTGTANFSGVVTSTAKALDRYTGSLYVGSNGQGGGDGNYALSYAGRSDTSFTALATDTDVTGSSIRTIALLRTGGNNSAATHVAFITTNTARTVHSLNISNKTIQTASTDSNLHLTDAIGAVANGLTYMTTSSNHIFVRTVGSIGFEHDNFVNGIANIRNNPFATIQGDSTTSSTLLSRISPPVYEAARLNSLTVSDMYWDPDIERLFITCTVDVATGNVGYALVKGFINTDIANPDDDDTIKLERILDDGVTDASDTTAHYSPRAIDDSTIFAYNNTGGAASTKITLHKVRVMTTSTNLKYLIVNGAIASGADIGGNQVHSLRISYTGEGDIRPGDVIRHDTYYETHLTNNYNNADHILSLTVGSAAAPWPNTQTVTDMVVIDDVVYISNATGNRSATNDPGLWKSQAMFNHEGIIVAWTPWERVYPTTGSTFPQTSEDQIPFFEVDANTGKIWSGDANGTTISRLKWKLPADLSPTTDDGTLQRQLIQELAQGCFCVLDLPNETPGMGNVNNTDNSIAIFGGLEKVIFARASQGNLNYTTPNTSFDLDANFKSTDENDGLFGVGAIRALGYSYNKTNLKGYFFAGTDIGLFAYAKGTGAGFNASTGLDTLASGELFDSADESKWFRVAESTLTPTTAVSQIITPTWNKIYVLTHDVTSVNAIQDKLYEIDIPNNINGDGAQPRIIAQSGSGNIPTNSIFSGCAILTTTDALKSLVDEDKGYFGVLSTNEGLYTSTCDLRHLVLSSGEWEAVVTTTGIPFHSIHRIKDRRVSISNSDYIPFLNTSFFGIPIIDDSRDLGIFENSTILQAGLSSSALSYNTNASLTTDVQSVQPRPLNVAEEEKNRKFILNKNSSDFSYLEFATNFYTDGGRRFFTKFNPNTTDEFSILRTLPYNADEWNMTTPTSDIDLSTINRIYWIENISGTGQLMAGIDSGVIVLN
ncbi:hypothetical protein KAW80_03175 [Candidatus Babeliales bacterium]|nr:hypothetical protein [Candidatus Babeliales bacterium]